MTDIDKIRDGIIDYRDDNCTSFIEKQAPTCQITDKDIENITKFMCHIMTKCPTNINLDDLRTGKILNRGGFGYTFKLGNDKRILIKISVCNPMNPHLVDLVIKETELHEILTKIDKDNFIKLYGYFRRTGDTYEYKGISNNFSSSIDCIDKKYNFEKSCEVYLLIEEGQYDLTKFKGTITPEVFTKFNDLLRFYKISKKTAKTIKKIFIHSDIKLENIILTYDDRFKLIDFGLSLLSDTFFTKAKGGTPYIFRLLFTYDNIYNDDLCVVSPLFDIFSLILSYFELCLKRRLSLPTYDFNKINELIIIFKEHLSIEPLLNSLLIIFNSIYNYHQLKLKDYYEDIKSKSTGGFFISIRTLLSSPIDNYMKSYNIEDIKITDIEESKLPRYINTGDKLKDDMDYLIKIINIVLPMNESDGDYDVFAL